MRLRRFFFSPDGAGGAAPAPAPAGGDGGAGNAAPAAPAGGANPAGAAPQQASRKLSARLTERFGELAAPEQPKIVKAADGSIDVDGYNSSMKSYTEGLERYNRATKFRQGISELLDNGLHDLMDVPGRAIRRDHHSTSEASWNFLRGLRNRWAGRRSLVVARGRPT